MRFVLPLSYTFFFLLLHSSVLNFFSYIRIEWNDLILYNVFLFFFFTFVEYTRAANDSYNNNNINRTNE